MLFITTGTDLDEAITMFVKKMVPEGTQITTDSLIKGVESFILCQPTSPAVYHGYQQNKESPSTITVVHCLGEPVDGGEQSELKRLRQENQEKTKRIEELEARELRFTGQIDKLEGDLLSLKTQFERYCKNMHDGGNRSTSSTVSESEQQFSGSSSAHSMSTPVDMSQAVVQHFNILSIDLRKFFTQMEVGDEVLKPFSQLPLEFQRNKSTKAARSKRLKLYNYMKSYPGGPKACIANFSKLTASQLYDREVKQTR